MGSESILWGPIKRMKYLEKQLMTGETIVKREHLHWIVYLPALCVAAAAAIGGGWLAGQGPHAKDAAEVIGGALGVYALYLALGGFIKRSAARFAVTNKRVLISLGLIRRRSVEILLNQIEGITVHQGFWGRIFNYGTVVIEGTGGDGAPYRHIAAPGAFRLAVQEQIEHYNGKTDIRESGRFDQLLKLDELRSKGALTETEFQQEKRKLLDPP